MKGIAAWLALCGIAYGLNVDAQPTNTPGIAPQWRLSQSTLQSECEGDTQCEHEAAKMRLRDAFAVPDVQRMNTALIRDAVKLETPTVEPVR